MKCVDIDEPGRQRLLSALGLSLRTLRIKFPNDPPAVPIVHPRESQFGLFYQAYTSLFVVIRC